jgi:Zn-dependent protease with chaperone function
MNRMQKIKIIIIGLFLSTILIGQDTIILKKAEVDKNGVPAKKFSGKVEIIEADKTIKIITSKRMIFFSFNDVDEVFDENEKLIWSNEQYNSRLNKELKLSKNKVIVNTKTGRIHQSKVLHLPDLLYQKAYDYKDLALSEGFELCKACFDLRPDIYDYDLEKQLTTQAIIAVKNRYEIMYEHEKLEFLSKMMLSVLDKWPESLKGYSYRLQIIRDDYPNALAIAGGNLYLTTGLIDMVENDKELEGVIAHEIAHIERRHTLRSFKAYQAKQLNARAIALLMSALVVVSGNSNVDALSQITELLSEYSTILAVKGYSRELEMEADMFSQIYFEQNKLNKRNLITVFDRLSTYSSTRLGYIPQTNAFSDHPSIINRINRVKDGSLYTLPEPIIIKLTPVGILNTQWNGPITDHLPPIKERLSQKEKRIFRSVENNFISIRIDNFYVAPSLTSTDYTNLFLLGSIINNHWKHYTLKEIKLNFPGKTGMISFSGLNDVNIFAGGNTEFIGNVSIKNFLSESVVQEILNKNLLGYVSVSQISIDDEKKIKKSFMEIQIASLITIE